jgi:hypothetical protein
MPFSVAKVSSDRAIRPFLAHASNGQPLDRHGSQNLRPGLTSFGRNPTVTVPVAPRITGALPVR